MKHKAMAKRSFLFYENIIFLINNTFCMRIE